MIMCWHCGNEVFSRACMRTHDGAFHADMRAMRMAEHERDHRAHNHPYTQLANGSRLYRRTG